MKNILLILFMSVFAFKAYSIPETLKADQFSLGRPTSGNAKSFSFDFGLGVLNPKLSSSTGSNLSFNLPFNLDSTLTTGGNITSSGNTLTVGDGTDTDKFLIFDKGAGASNPAFKYNATSGALTFNNGIVEKKIGSGSGGGGDGTNLVANSGFEDFSGNLPLNFTATGGTLTVENHVNSTEQNLKFARFVSTVAGEKVESDFFTVPDSSEFGSGGCMLRIGYNQGDSVFKYEVYATADLVNPVASEVVSNLTSFNDSSIVPFACTKGTQYLIRISSTAAGTIDLDDLYVGSNLNVSQIDQIITDWKSGGNLVITATTTNPTVGSVIKSDFLYKRVGDTLVGKIEFTQNGSGTNGTGTYRITIPDGLQIDVNKINSSIGAQVYDQGTILGSGTISNGSTNVSGSIIFRYASPTSIAVSIGVAAGDAGGATTTNMEAWSASWLGLGQVNLTLKGDITIPIVGWTANPLKTYAPSVTDFGIEAQIGSSTGTNTTVVNSGVDSDISEASLDMIIKRGNAQIPCVGNNSTGLTCALGAEIIGIVFDAPVSGKYKTCFEFSNASNHIAFRINETQNNSATVLQFGTGQYINSGGATQSHQRTCQTFNLNSGSKTIKLMNTSAGTTLLTDRVVSVSDRQIQVTVELIGQHIARPIIQNMVETSVSSGVRVESCRINNNGTATIDTASGLCESWISSTIRQSTGNVDLILKPNIYSVKPVCVVSNEVFASSATLQSIVVDSNNITIFRYGLSGAGSPADGDFNISCRGKK